MEIIPSKITRGIVVSGVVVVAGVLSISCALVYREGSGENLGTDTVEEVNNCRITESHNKRVVNKKDLGKKSKIQYSDESQRVLDILPEGRFKDSLLELNQVAFDNAIIQIITLGENIARNDHQSLFVDKDGFLIYSCSNAHGEGICEHSHQVHKIPVESAVAGEIDDSGEGSIPVSEPPVYHSLAGAENVIYLDFNGGIIENTAWNEASDWNGQIEVLSWNCKAFSSDEDYDFFSVKEQALIKEIWARVSENYASFNVDVTTEEPAKFNNNTAWAMITDRVDKNDIKLPHYSAGGIAYVNVFGTSSFNTRYSPAFVRQYTTSPYSAYTISHEIGHNLGLGHDGKKAYGTVKESEYYRGHQQGKDGSIDYWAPIMGASTADIIQWSKGDYYLANNDQDDLAIIADKLSYRDDLHKDTFDENATPIIVPINTTVLQKGLIERTGDYDVFSVSIEAEGQLVLLIEPSSVKESAFDLWNQALGIGLDIDIELYDDLGRIVYSNEESDSFFSEFEYWAQAGLYYLKISPRSFGNPLEYPPTGYTDYGAIGSYNISCQSITDVQVNFEDGEYGSITQGDHSQIIPYDTSAVAPTIRADDGYVFLGWDKDTYSIKRDSTITALYAKEDAILFQNQEMGEHEGWATPAGSDYKWISSSSGFSESGTFYNEPFDDWLGTCELTYTSTFSEGFIEFDYKYEGDYVWCEFFIDGVAMPLKAADKEGQEAQREYSRYRYPISAGVHTLKWNCVQGFLARAFIRNLTMPDEKQHTVSFRSDGHGTIVGDSVQTISPGGKTTSIEALPAYGYVFSGWADGSNDNPRMIENVADSSIYVATFTALPLIIQQIELTEGKNLVALSVIPENMNIQDMLKGILDKVAYVRDSKGHAFEKIDDAWRNNIGDWNAERGYLITMKEATRLDVRGVEIALPRKLHLDVGYTFVPVVGKIDADTFSLLDSISDSIEFIRDVDGNDFNPDKANDLSFFESGKSYLFKLSSEVDVTMSQ